MKKEKVEFKISFKVAYLKKSDRKKAMKEIRDMFRGAGCTSFGSENYSFKVTKVG